MIVRDNAHPFGHDLGPSPAVRNGRVSGGRVEPKATVPPRVHQAAYKARLREKSASEGETAA